MKIFENREGCWRDKVNFVDDNNVFVGYDLGQDCCEDAGWFISDSIEPYIYGEGGIRGKYDLDSYVFDKEFFESVESSDLEEGGMVVFKAVKDSSPDMYIHIYNSHNGYYGHGFEVKHSGETVKQGCL